MKVVTILGTRPEIIRLSLIIKKLDGYCDHILVHTGQNFDDNLSSIFFSDLGLREPDYYLGVRADTFGEQIGKIFCRSLRAYSYQGKSINRTLTTQVNARKIRGITSAAMVSGRIVKSIASIASQTYDLIFTRTAHTKNPF